MLIHMDTLSWFQANQLLLLFPSVVHLMEEINYIVFGLTQPELEPIIYGTRDEHSKH